MATVLQLRQMSTTTRSAYTPAVGEAVFDIDLSELFIGDGSTAGGLPAALGTEVVTRVLVGSAVPLTTGTAANVGTLAIPVGNWEVSGTVGFDEASGTIATEEIAAINTTSATLPTFPSAGAATARRSGTGATAVGSIVPVGPCRMTGTTTAYLIAQATFTVSTNATYGEIRAVRVA